MLENHKGLYALLGNNVKDVTIDNQQVRFFFDIGYLLGMIDGEGSCQLGRKYASKNGVIYTPKIGIYNSNPEIIQLIINIFKRNNIAFYFYEPKIHGKENRPCYRVEIIGVKRVKRLTDLLLNFPFGKQERIQILNDFCNYKLSLPKGRGYKENSLKTQAFRDLLKEKNAEHRGKITSETTRFNFQLEA